MRGAPPAGGAAGAVWEAAEWVPERLFGWEVIYGLSDAMTDLIANGVGALGAAVMAVVANRRDGRAPGAHPDGRAGRKT